MDAITLAYSSLGLQCPIGVRAHSTRGIASSWHGPAWGPFWKFVRRPAGPRRPRLQGFTTWTSLPYRPESFLLKLAILWVHLTNIVQAHPSLGLSILYGHQVSTLWNDTQATDDPMAQPVLGVFYWLHWVLLRRESWFWVISHHSTAWLYLFPYSISRRKKSVISKGNVLGYYHNLGSLRYRTSTAFLVVLWAAHLSRFLRRNLRCGGEVAAYIARCYFGGVWQAA